MNSYKIKMKHTQYNIQYVQGWVLMPEYPFPIYITEQEAKDALREIEIRHKYQDLKNSLNRICPAILNDIMIGSDITDIVKDIEEFSKIRKTLLEGDKDNE